MTVSHTRTQVIVKNHFIESDFEYQLCKPYQDSRTLSSVWQLVAANLAANGDVLPQDAFAAAQCSDFDFSIHTSVISIRHTSGWLAGTFSLTLDSDSGMPVTQHFDRELKFIRRKYRVINGWRFSMSPLFQSAVLRQRSFALFKQLVRLNDADAFVIYYNKRLDAYYQRLFSGRVMSSKTISFDGHNALPVNLMLCAASDNPPDPRYMHDGAKYEKDLVF